MTISQMLRAVPIGVTALAVITGLGTAMSAHAASARAISPAAASPSAGNPGFTSGKTYRVEQKDNGSRVCLDASFEFSVCQTSRNPDDPPAVQKWVIDPTGKSVYKIWNRVGTGDCLDLKEFAAPCSSGNGNQKWSLVIARSGTYYVEHQSARGSTCLDEFWTFKACSSDDAQQIWTLKLVS